MTTLILDQSVIDQLKSVEAGVEVRDRWGNLIGFFHPGLRSGVAPYFSLQLELNVIASMQK